MKISSFTAAKLRLGLIFALGFALCSQATVTNIAWYRLGEHDPGAASGQIVNSTTIDFIGTNNLKRFGSPRYTNNLSADAKAIGSTLAVQFDGSSQFYSNALVSTARNNFGIEAWVKPLAGVGTYLIAHNGRFSANGWGLVVQVSNDPFLGTVSGYSGELGGGIIVGGKAVRGSGWTHVALVRNNGTSTFYLNGVAAGPTTNTTPATPTIGFAIATTPESPHSDLLPGIVDEVRVFTFAAGQFSTNDLLVNQGVTTLEASSLTSTTATLNGNTTSADLPTTAWFEWGTDPTNLVNATSPQFLGSDFTITNFSDTITGLTAGVTYYFHAVATNALKTFVGGLKALIIGPTTRYWTGKAGVEWSNGANWLPAQGVQPGDDLVFVSALTTNFISSNDIPGIAINSIQIYAPMNLSGASLTVTNGITSAASDAAFIECPIVLGGDQEFSGDQSPLLFNGPIDLNGHDLTFNAISTNGANMLVQNVVSGVGNIIKNGPASLLFEGTSSNSFAGTLRVQNGLVSLEKSGAVSVNNRLEIVGPGIVEFEASDQLLQTCELQIETGGQFFLNGKSQTLNSPITLWDDAEIDGGGGSGTLSVTGPVIARTTNSIAVIQNGFLSLQRSNVVFDVDGCCLTSGYLDVSATINGSGGFRALGSGILRLSANSFTGPAVIETAYVIAANSSSFGTISGGVLLTGSGILKLSNAHVGNESLTVSSSGFQDVDDSGNTVRGARIEFEGTNSWLGPIFLQTNVFLYGLGADMTFAGEIVGSGGIWFNHGTFHFEPHPFANGYSGTTYARCELLTLNRLQPAIPGPLSVGFDAFTSSPTLEVRWLQSTQVVDSHALTLHSNGLVNLNNNRQQFKTVTFNGGHISTGLSGNLGRLQVTDQIISNPTNITALIDGTGYLSLLLTNAQIGPLEIIVGDGPVNPDLWINASIFDDFSFGFSGGLRKRGDGELLLSAQNGYGGQTEVFAGILQAEHDSALGANGSSQGNNFTTVHDGATLQVENLSSNFKEIIFLSGTGRGGTNGALYSLGGCTSGSPINLSADTTIRADSTSQALFINESIAGSGPITKTGSGFLTFGGPAANNYGETFVNQGRLTLQKPAGVAAIPSHLTISTAEVVHQESFLIVGSVTVNRGGLWNLNNFSEDFTVSALQGRPPLTLNGGGDVQTGNGILILPQGGDVVASPAGVVNANSIISGNLRLDPGSHHFAVGSATHLFPPILPELEISAVVSQTSSAADIIKDGPGQMRLDRTNSFTGGVTVNEGTLTVSNNFSLGSGGPVTVNGNGSLGLSGNGLLIQGTALTMNSSNAAALNIVSSTNTWIGPITLSRDASILVSPTVLPGFQSFGVVSGPGGLIKRGPGSLLFAGSSANTYAGLTTVAEGELRAARTATSLPGDVLVATPALLLTFSPNPQAPTGQLSSTSRVTVQFDAFWGLNSSNVETIRALSGPGSVSFSDSTARLTINNDIDCEFSGSFGGTGSLTKDGSGTLLLSGNSTSFSGTTTVIRGRCRVDGAMAGSPFILRGLIELQGDGIVGDVTTVDIAPLLRPNSKFPDHQGGDLEVGNLTLTNTSGLELDFFGPSSIGGNDSIVARGAVTLDHAFLYPSFHYAPHEGEVITALDKRSSGAISGTFSGLPQNSLLTVDNIACRVSYTGGDGNDVTLTVTNLPLSFAGAFVFSGNGNESIENDECVLLDVWLRNKRNAALTPTNVQLRTSFPDATVMVTAAQSLYAPIPPGQVGFNSTPFQIRATRQFICGGKVPLELEVTVPGEGTFAIPFGISGNSTNCATPGGGTCESCTVASGQFTTNTPLMAVRPYFVGDVSSCFPTKACPGADPDTNLPSVRFITHNFTNTTTRELCVTVQPHYDCTPQPTPANALGVSAYLGAFDPNQLCAGYLGDSGVGSGAIYPPFSFRVPAGTNFVVVVVARNVQVCSNYTVEVFGLPCPPPTLDIALDPAGAVVKWSTAYPDFTLQQAGDVTGTFTDILQPPLVVNSRYVQTNMPTTSNAFFRLKKSP